MKQYDVLIVDDCPDWCLLLKTHIEQYSLFDVLEPAHNGKDALERIQKQRPQIILLDLILPEYDGVYIIGYIHTYMKGYNPYIYVLSALDTHKPHRFTSDLEADYFSMKPLDPRVVVYNLHRIVGKQLAVTEPFTYSSFNLKAEVERYLLDLGIRLYMTSAKSLVAALLYVFENEFRATNVMALYQTIGDRLNTSSAAVERNIRSAVRNIQKANTLYFRQCFPHSGSKLTNAEFLATSLILLKRKTEKHSASGQSGFSVF